jgi:hypothetical protein
MTPSSGHGRYSRRGILKCQLSTKMRRPRRHAVLLGGMLNAMRLPGFSRAGVGCNRSGSQTREGHPSSGRRRRRRKNHERPIAYPHRDRRARRRARCDRLRPAAAAVQASGRRQGTDAGHRRAGVRRGVGLGRHDLHEGRRRGAAAENQGGVGTRSQRRDDAHRSDNPQSQIRNPKSPAFRLHSRGRSSTGLPCGVWRYASAHASLRSSIAAGSLNPFAATRRSSVDSQ